MLQERQVDGLILSPARLKDRSLEVLRGQERPFVLIDRNVENASLPCVMTDNRAGSAMAVDYLIRKGHSSIAYVGGPLQQMTGRDRFEGFKSAMAAHALEPAGLATIDAAFEKAVAAASALLRRRPRPTAIFAGNLTITLGAMEAVRAARLSVPSDIELVGFDDIPHAELMRYPVTTIAQQVEAMGREAFRLLLRQMKNDSPGDLVLLPPRLIVRQ
jgi:LacI family transcriptional regulator